MLVTQTRTRGERRKRTHQKVAKKWGKGKGEGDFSFVLPQMLHHSAVSNCMAGLTAL